MTFADNRKPAHMTQGGDGGRSTAQRSHASARARIPLEGSIVFRRLIFRFNSM
jgi:hypothetical protein